MNDQPNQTPDEKVTISLDENATVLKNEEDKVSDIQDDTKAKKKIVRKKKKDESISDEITSKKVKTDQDTTVRSKEVVTAEYDGTIDEEESLQEEEIDYSGFTREELILQLEEAVNSENINSVKNRISNIKVEFIKKQKEERQNQLNEFVESGGKEEEFVHVFDDFDVKFNSLFEIYKTKKKQYTEQQEVVKQENLQIRLRILEQLRDLVNSEETLKKTYDDFKALQEEWKLVGQVPRSEVNNLWQNYHFLVEKFFDKVKINKELKDLDLKKNLESKIQLCEKAEELLLSPSILRSFKELQKYHDEWKEIGPVPQDKSDEVWERFKNVSDKINQMRKEYYSQAHEEQQNNLLAKTALCEKIEELISQELNSVQEWKEKTDEISEMMKLWQAIGRAPAKQNDEIWARFKGTIDAFYESKKDYFSEIKEQQLNNYNLKVDICIQAETLKTNTNWKKTTVQLLKLQEDWKQIGPVPRKYSDKIWARFRAACDEFFNSKSEYYSNIGTVEVENLKSKTELIKSIEEYKISDDKNTNLEALRSFQREWMDIGHVPMDKKESIQIEYRDALNKLLDKLKISSVEAGTLNYKNKIESIKASPEASRIIFRERMQIENKISRLKNDINLWQNNIGFLANSKNADILKAEFDKKIKSAQDEVLLLEAKLKLIKRQD